jgi:type II secretion system protein G
MHRDTVRRQKGFTLIELLVVIAIIGILSSVVLASMNASRQKGRDAKRKQDFKSLQVALEMYYNDNNAYPSTGAAAANPGGGWYSTQAGNWIAALVTGGQISMIPKDPVNIDRGPWCWSGNSTQNTIYVYISDGQRYVLCGWMENTADSDTLQYKDVVDPWNTAQKLYANDGYSRYGYAISRW